jgi:hypothetical protein
MSEEGFDLNVLTEYEKAFIDGQEHEREQHRSYRLEKLVFFIMETLERKGLIEEGEIGDYAHYLHTGDWK